MEKHVFENKELEKMDLKPDDSILQSTIKNKKDFDNAKFKTIYFLHKNLSLAANTLDKIDKTSYKEGTDEYKLVELFYKFQELYQFFTYSDFELDIEKIKNGITFGKLLFNRDALKISCKEYEEPQNIDSAGKGNINETLIGKDEDGKTVIIKKDPFVVWNRGKRSSLTNFLNLPNWYNLSTAAGRQDDEQGIKNISDNISKQLFQQTIEEMIFGVGNTHYVAKTMPVRLKKVNKETEEYEYQWATLMEHVLDEEKGQTQGQQNILYTTESEKNNIEKFIKSKNSGSVVEQATAIKHIAKLSKSGKNKLQKSRENKIKYDEIYKPRKIDGKFILQTLDVGLIDYIAAQLDRHSGNYSIDQNGNVKLFDNDRILGINMNEKDYEQMFNEKIPIVTFRTALQMIFLVKNYAKNKNQLNIQCGFNQYDEVDENKTHKSKALIETEKRIVFAYNRIFGTNFDLNVLDSDKNDLADHAANLYNELKETFAQTFKEEKGELLEKKIENCLEIPDIECEQDRKLFDIMCDYFQKQKKCMFVNDYKLVEECKDDNKLKEYVDKFLNPEIPLSMSGMLRRTIYTIGLRSYNASKAVDITKKANLISASHCDTFITLMEKKKPTQCKILEQKYMEEKKTKQSKNKPENFNFTVKQNNLCGHIVDNLFGIDKDNQQIDKSSSSLGIRSTCSNGSNTCNDGKSYENLNINKKSNDVLKG